MSLDVSIYDNNNVEVYTDNITHNLNKMATAVSNDFYLSLWRPEELLKDSVLLTGRLLIPYIKIGLTELKLYPEKYKKYNPSNGWGEYKNLVLFCSKYLEALKKWPNYNINVSR